MDASGNLTSPGPNGNGIPGFEMIYILITFLGLFIIYYAPQLKLQKPKIN